MKTTKRTHKYSGAFVAQLKETLRAAQATRDAAQRDLTGAQEHIGELQTELGRVRRRESGTREVASNAIAALTSASAAIGFGFAHEARRTLLVVEREASRTLDELWPPTQNGASTQAMVADETRR